MPDMKAYNRQIWFVSEMQLCVCGNACGYDVLTVVGEVEVPD